MLSCSHQLHNQVHASPWTQHLVVLHRQCLQQGSISLECCPLLSSHPRTQQQPQDCAACIYSLSELQHCFQHSSLQVFSLLAFREAKKSQPIALNSAISLKHPQLWLKTGSPPPVVHKAAQAAITTQSHQFPASLQAQPGPQPMLGLSSSRSLSNL